MLSFGVLGTGSCGNSYVFSDGIHSIMVDCGYSFSNLSGRLQTAGFTFEEIGALFITHFHPDHVQSLRTISRTYGIPIFMSKKTVELDPGVISRHNLDKDSIIFFETDKPIVSQGFRILPFKTVHDCVGSVGYSIEGGGHRLTLITDTGIFSEQMVSEAKESELLFLESNYDPEMLRTGPYAINLKKRILGERGHLSNAQAVEFLELCGQSSNRQVYFVHVSENNNTKEAIEKAASACRGCFNRFTVCERGKPYSGVLK